MSLVAVPMPVACSCRLATHLAVDDGVTVKLLVLDTVKEGVGVALQWAACRKEEVGCAAAFSRRSRSTGE